MLNNLQIPKKLHRKIDRELHPGELIRWVGQPIPHFFTSYSISACFIGIISISFVIFWIWSALGFKLPNLKEALKPQDLLTLFVLLAFFVLPPLTFGFRMLSLPIGLWIQARNTVYIVTDQRAFTITAMLNNSSATVKSYLPEQLKNIHRIERADGTGDVIISIPRSKDSDEDETWKEWEETVFRDVRNPQEVENILKQLAQGQT